MPSSMIFVGLVVLWLLILVPAVARHRQEVARPSSAALAGRVLQRPRRRSLEVDMIDHEESDAVVTGAAPEQDRDGARPERPPPRYRRGRGGFDAEAAALTARARYAFRQRVVLSMLIGAAVTALIAWLAVPALWWAHAAIDLTLSGYLVYLRRQVRLEEAIRRRRAARMAGTRRPPATADPESDESAAPPAGPEPDRQEEPEQVSVEAEPVPAGSLPLPVEETPAPRESLQALDPGPALPRLPPTPPPTVPPGTTLLQADDEDPELYDLGEPVRPEYRRAVGE